MAEILIFIVDRGGVDSALGYGDYKMGDVITACPDNWSWSDAELTNPKWRIIRVPFLVSEVNALLAPGAGEPSVQKCWRRKYNLDFSKLPNAIKNVLLGPRIPPILDATSYLSQFRTAVLLKALN